LSDEIKPIVKPGTFPPAMLDQRDIWIDTGGYAHRIDLLDENAVLWSLDYALANASQLRTAWATGMKQTYDVGQRARRWMLDRAVIRRLMKRLIELEVEGL
jgi:hypothetical protein